MRIHHKKVRSKSYTKGAKGGYTVPMADTGGEVAVSSPLHPYDRVTGVGRSRFVRDDSWNRAWPIIRSVPGQILSLSFKLVSTAKYGSARGRYIRITPLQSNIVLGMGLVYTIAIICYIIDLFI
jgi:hypothetical protein